MTQRTILCFGDSNTHGTAPMQSLGQRQRYPADVRWPGVLAAELGPEWKVIEEGHGGRTTVHDDPIEGAARNGRTYLLPCLESHRPLDVVVLMLGTNDLKTRFSVTPTDIAWSLARLIEIIRANAPDPTGAPAKILLVAPTPIEEVGFLGEVFAGGAAKSRHLAAAIKEVARANGTGFLDAGAHIAVSPIDGIHFDPATHQTLGKAIAAAVDALV